MDGDKVNELLLFELLKNNRHIRFDNFKVIVWYRNLKYGGTINIPQKHEFARIKVTFMDKEDNILGEIPHTVVNEDGEKIAFVGVFLEMVKGISDGN